LKQIHFPKFSNVDGTIKYCRVIDRIFDFLNSKSIFYKGFKAPLSMKNIETLKEVIIPLIHYLYKLKFDGKFLYKSDKKKHLL